MGVTYRNTNPGPHLLDVIDKTQVEAAIEEALTMPETLMQSIKDYTWEHEAHRDGNNSARVLDAVDDFNDNHKGILKAKPRNWLRKFKLRNKLGYWK